MKYLLGLLQYNSLVKINIIILNFTMKSFSVYYPCPNDERHAMYYIPGDVSIHAYIHSIKKIPGIGHSKSPLKEIVKNLFDAKLARLFSILTWSSSAICHLVCSQCSMLSVYLKCVSRFFQSIRISNKELVSNFALQMEFRVKEMVTVNRNLCLREPLNFLCLTN